MKDQRFWTFGKGAISKKERRAALQRYNHAAAVEFAKAKRRELGSAGAASEVRRPKLSDDEIKQILERSK